MKARFLLLAAVLFTSVLASCEKTNEKPEPEPEPEAVLAADPLSLSFAASEASPQEITVESENVSWTVSLENECEWIGLETNGNVITVTVSDNDTFDLRSERIVISPDNESVETVYVSVEQAGEEKPEAVMLKSSGIATYYAMDFLYSTNFNGEWLINLYTEESDVKIDWVNFGKDGYWSATVSNGRCISLYMYCDLSEDFFNPSMVSGEYNPCPTNNDIDNMTFTLSQDNPNGLPWPNGSYIEDFTNGAGVYTYITDGKIKVETDGKSYEIDIYLVTEDGEELYYKYSGELNLSLLGRPPYYSDLTEDFNVGKDDFSSSAAYNSLCMDQDYALWNVQLVGNGISSDAGGNVTGEGVLGNLQFVALTSAGLKSIPEGTYTIDPDYNIYDPYEGGATAGRYDPVMGNSGCYFDIYSSEGVAFAPVNEGTVEVENLGDGNYRIVVSGKDDNSHNISVTYEGSVTILE